MKAIPVYKTYGTGALTVTRK